MTLTPVLLEELELLNMFNLGTTQQGLKIHHDAAAGKIAAGKRLFAKGMITDYDPEEFDALDEVIWAGWYEDDIDFTGIATKE